MKTADIQMVLNANANLKPAFDCNISERIETVINQQIEIEMAVFSNETDILYKIDVSNIENCDYISDLNQGEYIGGFYSDRAEMFLAYQRLIWLLTDTSAV